MEKVQSDPLKSKFPRISGAIILPLFRSLLLCAWFVPVDLGGFADPTIPGFAGHVSSVAVVVVT